MSTAAERVVERHAATVDQEYDWKFITRLEKGGHKLFKDGISGRYAIGDNSGRTPDQTEDDVLWLVDTWYMR